MKCEIEPIQTKQNLGCLASSYSMEDYNLQINSGFLPPKMCRSNGCDAAIMSANYAPHKAATRAVLNGEKRCFPKKARGHTMCWRWAVGGWRLAVGGWRLVAVGGGWWWLAAVGAWGLVVDGAWQWLAVGGWSPLAVGGGWRLAVDGPLGRSLRAVLNKNKI